MAHAGGGKGGGDREADPIETWVGDGSLREDGESEERRALRTLLRNLPGFVYRCRNDRAWTMEYISPQCLELTGHAPEAFLSGAVTLGGIIHPDDAGEVWDRVQAGLAGERPFQLSYRVQAADGSIKHVWEQGIAVPGDDNEPRLEGFIWDVTEQRQLETQLAHSQRVESVGRLAGGVAHDFNNLLTVVSSYVELLAQKLTGDEMARRDLDEIGQAAERGAELTRQLLAFARHQELDPEVIEIDRAIAGIERMLRRLLNEDIELHFDLGAPGACCRVDRGQLEVAVTNLAVNARDAMSGGGRLTVTTRVTEADDAVVAPGPRALISVQDEGCGMDEATLRRIFDPFFTTKPVGRGTGLGLATVMRIVRRSEGSVQVESAPGRGARFELRLPLVEGAPLTDAPPPAALDAPGGDERILVVEDMPVVRKLCGRILRQLGYAVLEAPTPNQALELVAGQGAPSIDLLLTDVVMPQMPGPSLAQALRRERPGLRVVFMSGYPEDLERERRRSRSDTFVAKPFSPHELASAIRTALDIPAR